MELSDATEKAPATPGIDPGTFRLVAQCLNHYATPGPICWDGTRENITQMTNVLFNDPVNCSLHTVYTSVSQHL
jgi:hypothetical protein